MTALAIAGGAWWLWPTIRPSATPGLAAATSIAQPLVTPRLSIVVLPFTNLSNDPEQQYFADGITEDLTTDLSRITASFVIARSTAFTFKGKQIDAKQIGRELGVRYLLEGSVRRSGQQVRVNTQLVDAETGAHLWAERLDRDMGDLFRLQNEITGQIARTLQFDWPLLTPDVQPNIPTRSTTSCGGGRRGGSRHTGQLTPRPSACSSVQWLSIPAPSRRRSGWRSWSLTACTVL
jgi:TolB-like protein